MRSIGIVTCARSDYGIYKPILDRMRSDDQLECRIFATGMHLSPEFGQTYTMIESDGFRIYEKIEMLLSSDTPEGIAKSVGLGILGFAQAFGRSRPDILVVLGDRFEMYTAAIAALPFKIPLAHIHGGEISQGAMDEALRHSITKLSHLHFVATLASAQRVAQLGEDPKHIVVSGAPALDHLGRLKLLGTKELEERFDLDLTLPPLLVTYHPVSLEYELIAEQCRELLSAITACGHPAIFTLPNADTGSRRLIRMIQDYVATHPKARMVANLGSQGYFSLMALALAMVGNSSSGIIEAASFQLPVVNIGTRQKGRLAPENVIHTGNEKDDILAGIRKAVSFEFRRQIAGMVNPYGTGRAAEIIVDSLKALEIDQNLICKPFMDLNLS